MKDPKARLSYAELALLDALIVFALQKGYDPADDDSDPPSGAAAGANARHDGFLRLMDEYDRTVTARIRELAQGLDDRLPLQQLLALRGQAIRGG